MMNRKLSSNLRFLFRNEYVLFTFFRYFGLGLQFIKSFLLAWILGPVYYGFIGYINLGIQYFAFSNLGVQLSLNIELSGDSLEKDKGITVFNAFFLTLVNSIVFILFTYIFINNFYTISEQEFVNEYLVVFFLVVFLLNFSNIFKNIYRSYAQAKKIIFDENLFKIAPLFCVIFFEGKALILAVLLTLLISQVISNLIYIFDLPLKVNYTLSFDSIKILLRKGVSLMIYSLGFYLIIMLGQSFVGMFYDLEAMGYFSFAVSLAAAAFLGLNSFSYIIYSKIISKFKKIDNINENVLLFNEIKQTYSIVSFIILFISLLLSYILCLFLIKYQPAFSIILVLLVSQTLLNLTFTQNTLAISKNFHRILAVLTISIVLIQFILNVIIVNMNLTYNFISYSILLSSFLYLFIMQGFYLNKFQKRKINMMSLSEIIGIKNIFFVFLILSVLLVDYSFMLYPVLILFALYILVNISEFISALRFVKQFLLNSKKQ